MKRIGQSGIEWALLAVIAFVCGVLSFLQYRWTGELSRAEPALLRAGLNDQLRRLTQAFNNDLRETCTALLPGAAEIGQPGSLQAHYAQWATSHDRLLFARIAIAAPEKGTLKLYGIDRQGQLSGIEWPPSWEQLRSAMAARLAGSGRPPNARPDSNIIELPVFAAGNSGQELEWMIFDLDEDYVRATVLPRLAAEYLNSGGDRLYDVSISRSGPTSVATAADAAAGMFPVDMGTGSGRGRGLFRWIISVRHREGSLDAAVARARTRNLLASLLLVALLGGTAWALVQYTARSRRLSEMQFRFAAGVSHDLRTPLTAIRGAAFNVAEGVVREPAAIQRYAKLILRNAEELTSMIENVLAFSASLHSSKQERQQAISIGDLLQHAAAAMQPEIEQAGCHIEVTIAPNLPAVAGDSVAVELVFRNLIGNAVRHGSGGKWVGVSAAPAGDGVEVRVSDRGPGILEPEQKRIFEPFYRSQQTRARQVPGTGLGLSLARTTVERHKGTIEVHNSPAGGAQFIVRLPVIAKPA